MNASDGTLNDLVSRAKEHNIIPRGKLRQMMDNLPVGLYWNLPGGQGTFLYVNQTLVDMFGYGSREEFMNIAAVDLYPDPGNREEFSRRLLDDGKLRGIELKLKKKDGTLIWCRESSHAVHDEQGKVVCFLGAPCGEAVRGRTAFWDWPGWDRLMQNTLAWLAKWETGVAK